jgi:glycosyltransferase involved in cell wall biosynthesis
MRVLHVPFCYYPDPAGGTEVYVASLAQAQRKQGLDVAVAAPADRDATYERDGIPVYRFQIADKITLRQLYGEGDDRAAQGFLEILKSWRPDVVNLHAFTSGVSLKLVLATRHFGASTVFTYHTPTVTCTRGTLLRWGSEVCDGRMETRLCARCTLQGKGVPRPVSWVLGGLPQRFGAWAGTAGFSGGTWTALRMTELVGLRHQATRSLFSQVDHIVAVCEWVRDLLIRNGVPAEKITLSRQGLPYAAAPASPAPNPGVRPVPGTPQVRLAFLGRLDRVKGVEILIEALAECPHLPVSLDVYAIAQGAAGSEMEERLVRKAAPDARIQFLPALAASDVVDRLRSYDALLVPSQWLETGPLVVYEAFAAGIPVIGSDLGGIAELVRDGENGILVKPRAVSAWVRAVTKLVENPELLVRLQTGRQPIRNTNDVTSDMRHVYEKVLAKRTSSTKDY